ALDRHLQAVRQQVAMAVRLAVFAIVVDRMIVAARELERCEQGFGLGPRIYVEPLADPQILEPMSRPETVCARVKWGFRHFCSPCVLLSYCEELSSGPFGFHPFTRSATSSRPLAWLYRYALHIPAAARGCVRDDQASRRPAGRGRCDCASRPPCRPPSRPARRMPSRRRTG